MTEVETPSNELSRRQSRSNNEGATQPAVGEREDGGADAPQAEERTPHPTPDALQSISQADVDVLLQAAAEADQGEAPAHGLAQEVQRSKDSPGPLSKETSDGQVDAKGDTNSASPAGDEAPSSVTAAPKATDPVPPTHSLELQDFDDRAASEISAKRVTMLNDVNLRVKIQLGRTRMLVEDVLKLGEGSVVELDTLAGDPVDVLVNDRLIARGEVLVLNDNFCVRVSEVVSSDPHRMNA